MVYNADQDTDGVDELYSVPIAGGTVTKLNAPLVSGGQVEGFSGATDFRISADSSRVVYSADQDTDQVFELYSVPIAGGTVIKLNGPMVSGGDLNFSDFSISPDSSRVVYLADQETDEVDELFSVPIAGGTVTKLNSNNYAPGGFAHSFTITADSAKVIFLGLPDSGSGEDRGLYSVPIAGGTATLISNPLGDFDGISRFTVSPDVSRVVFTATLTPLFEDELFSVPITGGTVTKLNSPFVSGGELHILVQISADSSRVVYAADQDTDEVTELYSVPIAGGTVTKLNAPLIGNDDVGFTFHISPDSSRVVYTAGNFSAEIYSVPITGGVATKLNGPLTPGGSVSGGNQQLTPDGSRVVYYGDQDTDEVSELYIVPITGGTVTKLSDPMVSGGDVKNFKISADNNTIVYIADQDTDGVHELYSVGISIPSGPATVPTLSEWGIITLVLGLAGASFIRIRRMNLQSAV